MHGVPLLQAHACPLPSTTPSGRNNPHVPVFATKTADGEHISIGTRNDEKQGAAVYFLTALAASNP